MCHSSAFLELADEQSVQLGGPCVADKDVKRRTIRSGATACLWGDAGDQIPIVAEWGDDNRLEIDVRRASDSTPIARYWLQASFLKQPEVYMGVPTKCPCKYHEAETRWLNSAMQHAVWQFQCSGAQDLAKDAVTFVADRKYTLAVAGGVSTIVGLCSSCSWVCCRNYLSRVASNLVKMVIMAQKAGKILIEKVAEVQHNLKEFVFRFIHRLKKQLLVFVGKGASEADLPDPDPATLNQVVDQAAHVGKFTDSSATVAQSGHAAADTINGLLTKVETAALGQSGTVEEKVIQEKIDASVQKVSVVLSKAGGVTKGLEQVLKKGMPPFKLLWLVRQHMDKIQAARHGDPGEAVRVVLCELAGDFLKKQVVAGGMTMIVPGLFAAGAARSAFSGVGWLVVQASCLSETSVESFIESSKATISDLTDPQNMETSLQAAYWFGALDSIGDLVE